MERVGVGCGRLGALLGPEGTDPPRPGDGFPFGEGSLLGWLGVVLSGVTCPIHVCCTWRIGVGVWVLVVV